MMVMVNVLMFALQGTGEVTTKQSSITGMAMKQLSLHHDSASG
jgi:hypothetical protein